MTGSRMLRARRDPLWVEPCPECGAQNTARDWAEIGSCRNCYALLPRDDEPESDAGEPEVTELYRQTRY